MNTAVPIGKAVATGLAVVFLIAAGSGKGMFKQSNALDAVNIKIGLWESTYLGVDRSTVDVLRITCDSMVSPWRGAQAGFIVSVLLATASLVLTAVSLRVSSHPKARKYTVIALDVIALIFMFALIGSHAYVFHNDDCVVQQIRFSTVLNYGYALPLNIVALVLFLAGAIAGCIVSQRDQYNTV